MKRELKKSVVYGLYGISFLFLLGAILLPIFASKNGVEQDFEYVSKGILDYENNVKVVNIDTNTQIIRPYNNDKVEIVRGYYDYKATSESQEKSLIYYEGTYMQSSGVAYATTDAFDVVTILDGTVERIENDDTLGNIVTIKHNSGITSVYQSVSDIIVNEGDTVIQGSTIAKSSTSNISSDLGNHLYFELIIDGVCVNPEEYYGKNPNEL